MAYSYDDFTKAATSAGMLQRFSQTDLDTAKLNPEYGMSMLKLFQDENGATTTEQKLLAQETVNQLRKSYGTSAPVAVTDTTGAESAAGSFAYQNETEYQKLLDRIVNRDAFIYDPSADPQAAAYRKQFLREAERARENTIAKAAANSGGTPSSFAVTAAQQAGDYYVGQLNDALPSLQQNAYQRYLNDVSADISALDAMNTDRNFDYSAYLQKWQEEKDKLAAAAELMAGVGDYSLLAQYLGLTPEQLAKLQGENTGPAGYDNGGINPHGVRVLQNALGVEPTGVWSPETQQAALARWGVTSAADAYQIYTGGADQNADGWKDTGGLGWMTEMWPGGIVTNGTIWEMYKALYGEDALRSAGLSYGVTAGGSDGGIALSSVKPWKLPNTHITQK